MGSLTSPAVSALSGGLLTVLGAAVIGSALPAFRRYRFGAVAGTAGEAGQQSGGEHLADVES